jgi:hypothetical protein
MVAVTRWISGCAVNTDSGGSLLRIPGLFRFVAVVALSACASSGATTGARQQPDLITSTEISASGTTNAWDLINRLRPHWLRPQAVGSIGGAAYSQVIVVYVDGQRFGDISSLRTLSVTGIRSLQWLDAARAATVLSEVGSDPIAGAIIIKTH